MGILVYPWFFASCTQYLSSRKGNFAEMSVDVEWFQIGYEDLHVNKITSIDAGGHHGIDHIFKNPVTNEYIIVESKYHGSVGLRNLADGTRQMSDEWISDGSKTSSDRLWKAVGEDLNLYNQMKPSPGVNNYKRVVGFVKADGTINYKYVSENGYEISTVFNN